MSRMVKGSLLLVEKLPDDVSIETVRSAFSDFGEVKWVDINKSASEVRVAFCLCLPPLPALLLLLFDIIGLCYFFMFTVFYMEGSKQNRNWLR